MVSHKKALKKERQERKKQEIKQRQQHMDTKPTFNRIRREDAFAHMEEDIER